MGAWADGEDERAARGAPAEVAQAEGALAARRPGAVRGWLQGLGPRRLRARRARDLGRPARGSGRALPAAAAGDAPAGRRGTARRLVRYRPRDARTLDRTGR